MRRLLLLCFVLLTLTRTSPNAARQCDIIKLAPRQSLAPVRYIRFTTVIEDRGGGKVVLVDEGGEMTSSLVQPGPRTTLIEWKNIVLGPGEYEVVLLTGTCTARSPLTVVGDQ